MGTIEKQTKHKLPTNMPSQRWYRDGDGGCDTGVFVRRWQQYALKLCGLGDNAPAGLLLAYLWGLTRQGAVEAYPTRPELAARAMCSTTTVDRAIELLEARGLVSKRTIKAQKAYVDEQGIYHPHSSAKSYYAVHADSVYITEALRLLHDEPPAQTVVETAVESLSEAAQLLSEDLATVEDIDVLIARLSALKQTLQPAERVDSQTSADDEPDTSADDADASEVDQLAAADIKRPAKPDKGYTAELADAWVTAKRTTGASIDDAVGAYRLYCLDMRFNEPDGTLPSYATPMARWLTTESGLPTYHRRYTAANAQRQKKRKKPLPPVVPCPHCGEEMRRLGEDSNRYSQCLNGHGTYLFDQIVQLTAAERERGNNG